MHFKCSFKIEIHMHYSWPTKQMKRVANMMRLDSCIRQRLFLRMMCCVQQIFLLSLNCCATRYLLRSLPLQWIAPIHQLINHQNRGNTMVIPLGGTNKLVLLCSSFTWVHILSVWDIVATTVEEDTRDMCLSKQIWEWSHNHMIGKWKLWLHILLVTDRKWIFLIPT